MTDPHDIWSDIWHETYGLSTLYTPNAEGSKIAEWSQEGHVVEREVTNISDLISQCRETICPLRIIWVPYNHNTGILGVKKESLSTLNKELGLEAAYRYGAADFGGLVQFPSTDQAGHESMIFVCRILWQFFMYWSHEPSKNQSICICVGAVGRQSWLRSDMSRFGHLMGHTMLPAVLLATTTHHLLYDRYADSNQAITEVAYRTKNHGFPSGQEVWKAADGSLSALSARLSGCAMQIAQDMTCNTVQWTVLQNIGEYNGPSPGDQPLNHSSTMLNLARALLRQNKMLEIKLQELERQCNTQLTALFHMITSKETRLNIAIAEEARTLASATKEDSTAMKTLAVVTVLFLPGTFVSALFAVPLFQWDATGTNKVLSHRFWIYWAVAVPLTLMVFTPWIVWTQMKAAKNRKKLEEATKKFQKAVEGLGEQIDDDDDDDDEKDQKKDDIIEVKEILPPALKEASSSTNPASAMERGLPFVRKRLERAKLAGKIFNR